MYACSTNLANPATNIFIFLTQSLPWLVLIKQTANAQRSDVVKHLGNGEIPAFDNLLIFCLFTYCTRPSPVTSNAMYPPWRSEVKVGNGGLGNTSEMFFVGWLERPTATFSKCIFSCFGQSSSNMRQHLQNKTFYCLQVQNGLVGSASSSDAGAGHGFM